jgi:predicted dehydrogenase
MSTRFGFAGFRHNHAYGLYKQIVEMDDAIVVGACEDDASAREEAAENGVEMTHTTLDELLADTSCDVIAIGDYFTRRGSLAIQALSAGKHVLVDKPLCTSLDELDEIERLARQKELKVGCMLTMRDMAQIIGVRDLIRAGTIGDVQAISFGGQHPLNRGTRPAWFFEPGKHGGTINDIAIHAMDCIPWVTGLEFALVNSARCWNAYAPDVPYFKDGAQMMLTMNNDCGVLGDVSYFMPSPAGYTLPYYWRMTFFGSRGLIETFAGATETTLALFGAQGTESRPLPEGNPGGYLQSFLKDIRGEAKGDALNTEEVLRATRVALTVQRAADENEHDVSL